MWQEEAKKQAYFEQIETMIIPDILKQIDEGKININILLDKLKSEEIADNIRNIADIILHNKEIKEELRNPKQNPEHTKMLCHLIFALTTIDKMSLRGLGISLDLIGY